MNSSPVMTEQNAMNQNNMNGMFKTFRQNPMQFLMQRKINIPQEFSNNPEGAVQYLLNSGAMSQDTYNRLQQMATQMMGGFSN